MKVSVFFVGVICLAASVAGAAAAPQKGRAAARAERGREVYTERCARCHGADGQGRTRMGETVEAPDLSDPDWQRQRSDARMVAAVANGRGSMPPFKRKLSRQDIAASVAYVRTLRR
jgi:mono/diheme cytochrome c family protein